MACFLIDFENESGGMLEGFSLLNLKRNDEIILFYSENTSHLTMNLHTELESCQVKKLYIKAEAVKRMPLIFSLYPILVRVFRNIQKRNITLFQKTAALIAYANSGRKEKLMLSE